MRRAPFLAELKRRRVLRVAGAYVAIGLATIYASDVILPRLGLPDWTVTLVIVLAGLGLPLALGLAWAFDFTEAGIERTPPTAGAVTPEGDSGAEGPGTEGTAAGIVVLPFADMSPGGDHEYFADGLTEEIITDLAGIGALNVISRTSAMCFKGTERNAREIGLALNVRYILEGSVRVAGQRLRITAQLIDARTDAHLWADRYDGALDEVFDVQERVAREIVEALDLELTQEEDARLSEHPVADPRAFEIYARVRHQLRGFATEGAHDLLRRAIAIEGETLPLRALVAWTKVTEVRAGSEQAARLLDEAEAEARELDRLAPGAGLGAPILGFIAYERGEPAQAIGWFDQALAVQPNDADTLFFQGISYNAAGATDAGAQVARRLLASDPLNASAHMLAAITPWFTGSVRDAIVHMDRSLELDPDNLIGRWCDGYARALVGEMSRAERQAAWLAERAPDFPYTHQLVALVAAVDGRPEAALEALSRLNLDALDGHHSFHVAESFAMAGSVDRGLDLLDLAIDRGFFPLEYIDEHCPFLEPLRGLEGFEPIREKVRLRAAAFRREVSTIEPAGSRAGR